MATNSASANPIAYKVGRVTSPISEHPLPESTKDTIRKAAEREINAPHRTTDGGAANAENNEVVPKSVGAGDKVSERTK
ncbi:Protein of unknown function [Pyronema omphalodes CBS 100304]|uniref:Uncharacterized protein n=1 Tax=Pyronema omphalodes (strain CBS 100304) TaxID=1076935 RepID=U4KUH0_PYROM|nr:Protein of unknown function [Pyronema omphalodes CBS 100304]